MQQVKGTSLLVTIGEDLSTEAVMKVWALDQIEKKTGAPKCLSTVKILNGLEKFPVSRGILWGNLGDGECRVAVGPRGGNTLSGLFD